MPEMDKLASERVDMELPWADDREADAILDENSDNSLAAVTARLEEARQEVVASRAA